MVNTFEGRLVGKGRKFAVVISRFNSFISNRLLAGAEDALMRHEVAADAVDIYWVPGSFEIPLTARKLADRKDYDAVICLGAIIRGETPHFDYVAAEAAKGVAQVGLETGRPVIFGIVTADTLEQAVDRAGAKAGNKGADAAMAALEMADLFDTIGD